MHRTPPGVHFPMLPPSLLLAVLRMAASDDLQRVAPPTVVVYPEPPDEVPSADFTVGLLRTGSAGEHPDRAAIEQQPVFVYASYMFNAASAHLLWGRPVSNVSFTYFDFGGGPVSLVITLLKRNRQFPANLSDVAIRPLCAGLRLTPPPAGLDANYSATLTLTDPINLSLEPWGIDSPLHIFANPLEHDARTPRNCSPSSCHTYCLQRLVPRNRYQPHPLQE